MEFVAGADRRGQFATHTFSRRVPQRRPTARSNTVAVRVRSSFMLAAALNSCPCRH